MVSVLFAFACTGCSFLVDVDSESVSSGASIISQSSIESQSSVESSETSDVESKSKPDKTYSYDTLQGIFNNISAATTTESIETDIAKNSLSHTAADYNGSYGKTTAYRIAYTEGCALQRYADSGDYLDVSFDKASGEILHAQYVNSKCERSALYFNYGIWYDFDFKAPSTYSGYYSIAPLEKENGIVLKYDNGYEKATNYFKCDSAAEAVNLALDSEF